MSPPSRPIRVAAAPRLRKLALSLALSIPMVALAQGLPDAGDALRESTPPPQVVPPEPAVSPLPVIPAVPLEPAERGGAGITLQGLRFSGNTVFSDTQLQAMVADAVGREVTLADLELLAARITEAYRDAGFVLAEAIVPVQEVRAGVVEISVIEGVVGEVRIEVEPTARIRPEIVEGFVSRVQPGRPLRGGTLERMMLLLSDLPGIQPQAAIEQGVEPGAADLVVSVEPRRGWDLGVDVDNHGSRATSRYRAGVTARLNSPFRIGDNLDARLQLGSAGRLVYGRLSYELPLGSAGTRLGLSFARVEYQLGKDFAALDASGKADVIELGLTHPLVRSRSRNLFGRIGLQHKKLEDTIGVIDLSETKKLDSVYAGLIFEARDAWLGGGYSSVGLTGYFGRLDLRDPQARSNDRDGLRTRGAFQRWSYNAYRLNRITDRANLFVGVTGQFASRNLDSAEKVSLGGPRAVRAYAPAEATVDEGHILNLELRYSVSQTLSVQAFYDWSWGRYNHKPLPGVDDNSVRLRGYGVGTHWDVLEGATLRATLAWRDTGRGLTEPDRSPRVYMQFSKVF